MLTWNDEVTSTSPNITRAGLLQHSAADAPPSTYAAQAAHCVKATMLRGMLGMNAFMFNGYLRRIAIRRTMPKLTMPRTPATPPLRSHVAFLYSWFREGPRHHGLLCLTLRYRASIPNQ